MLYVQGVESSEKSAYAPKYIKQEHNNAYFSSKLTKHCVLRAAWQVLTMGKSCTTIGVQNRVQRAIKRRNVANRKEIRKKDCILRAAGLVSRLEIACTKFCVYNGVK